MSEYVLLAQRELHQHSSMNHIGLKPCKGPFSIAVPTGTARASKTAQGSARKAVRHAGDRSVDLPVLTDAVHIFPCPLVQRLACSAFAPRRSPGHQIIQTPISANRDEESRKESCANTAQGR
ncbi:hypothetical protein SCHPADRAFT_765810 [Schizopora paradoxa]|uniref:Uncharacterized protein n=1 Tax=Schizopora paradoxa TaxID=27342 RepID=A0A0H2R336_9AGAM|nr:hypothetical protein SCHPADRAFT_765810 [Schizopora paradoxa]